MLDPGLTKSRLSLRDGDVGIRYAVPDNSIAGEARNTSPRPLLVRLEPGVHRLRLETSGSREACRWEGEVVVSPKEWTRVACRPVTGGHVSKAHGKFTVRLGETGHGRGLWRLLDSRRAAAVACVLMAVFFAAMAAMQLDLDRQLGPEQPTTQAVVVGHSGRATVLEFTVRGETVRTATEEVMCCPDVGSTVQVRYNPEDPEYYVRDLLVPSTNGWLIGGLFAASGGFVVAAALNWRSDAKFRPT